jgi:membrane protease YdiL (CAAX protease family)
MDRRKAEGWRWAVVFFVVICLITTLFWLLILRSGKPLSARPGPLLVPLLVLFVLGPSGVALFLSAIEGGGRGVVELLSQAGRWRFGLGWYAVAILLAPLLFLVTMAIATLLGGRAYSAWQVNFLGALLHVARQANFLGGLLSVAVLVVGKEFGWRGYALPRLQGRIRPLPASLVMGVIQAALVLPTFASLPVHDLSLGMHVALVATILVSESVLATWLYNSTGRSVLATMLFYHSIHHVPLPSSVFGLPVFALVNVASAAAAIVTSGGSLVGVRRNWPLRTSVQPRSS